MLKLAAPMHRPLLHACPVPRIPLALAMTVLFAAACTDRRPGGFFGDPKPPKRGRTLVFGNGAEPEYLDPGLSSESSGSEITRNLWEGLTEYDTVTLDPVPGVAKSWDISPDGTTYTFHLRKDAKWSNGDPVTSEDFRWSWIRVLTPETISQYADMLYTFVVNARDFYLRTMLVVGKDGAELTSNSDPKSPRTGGLRPGDWVKVLACDKAKLATRRPAPVPAPLAGDRWGFERKGPTDPPHRISLEGAGAPKGGGQDLLVRDPTPITVVQWRDGSVNRSGEATYWVQVRPREGGRPLGWFLKHFVEQESEVDRCMVRRVEKGHAPDPVPGEAAAPDPLAAPAPVEGWTLRDRLEIDSSVVGIETPDPYTFVVQLKHPVPFFLELMSWVTFRPAHRASVEKHGKLWTRPEFIVCNGPFVLTDWRIQYQLVLEPNPHYWDRGAVKLDKVVALSIDNNHAVVNLYEASEVDWTGPGTSLPSEYQDFLATKDDFIRTPYLGSYFYWVNVHAEPVNDSRIRRALAMTMDREKIVRYVTRAGQIPVSHIVPAGLGGYEPPKGPEHNPEAARKLLAEAGYPGGKGMPKVELIYNTSEGHRKVAEAVQQMWKDELGIEVSISNQEWKVFLKNLQYKFYQVGRMGWIGDYRDPYTFLSLLVTDGGHNYGGYANPAYDALLDRAIRTTDKAKRLKLYAEAEAIALHDLPILPIYTYTRSWMVKPYVRGVFPNDRDMHPLKHLWIDEDWEPGQPYGPDPKGLLGRGKVEMR